MRKILIGILIGIFLCVSFFELIHRTVEVEVKDLCSLIYDTLTKQWKPQIVYQVKVVYKFFAWPVKTIWINLQENGELYE